MIYLSHSCRIPILRIEYTIKTKRENRRKKEFNDLVAMVFEVAVNMNSWTGGNSNMEDETYMGIVEEVIYAYIGLKPPSSTVLILPIR